MMANFGKRNTGGEIEKELDPETNEVVKKILHMPIYEKIIMGGWFMAMQDGFEWLAKQDLTGEQFKVLIYIMSKIDFENYLMLTQKEVAEALGMKKENVSRTFKVLVSKGFILEGPKSGRAKTYKLDPNLGYKGKTKNYIRDLKFYADEQAKKGITTLTVIDGGKRHVEE